MSLVDKIGEYHLLESRRGSVRGRSSTREGVDELGWHHCVAEAQARRQDFAKATGVYNAAIGVETLQRRDWPATISVLAIVIILNDPGAGAARPIQQRESTSKRHRHSERVLVRRLHERQSGPRCKLNSSLNDYSFAVHRHSDESRSGGNQSGVIAEVSWIFDPCYVVRLEEESGRYTESLLRAVEDENLVRLATDSARTLEVFRDGNA